MAVQLEFSQSCMKTHAYIIGHYNPSVRKAQLLTPLIQCALILCESGGTYSLTPTPNDRFLKNFFTVDLCIRVFARNLMRGNGRRNSFRIEFLMTDLGYEPRLLRLPPNFSIHILLYIFQDNRVAKYCCIHNFLCWNFIVNTAADIIFY